jgi:probable blue pigment (indigoidine) exporter
MSARTISHILSVATTALAPMIWGSTYLVTTQWLPANHPISIAVIRVLPAGLLLLLYCREWPRKHNWLALFVLSALNIAVFQTLLFVAAYRLPGGIAAIFGAMQPLFLMLLVWFFDRVQPALITVIAALVGVFGMSALLLTPTTNWDERGLLAAFFGATAMGVGTYLARRWQVQLSIFAFTGWQLTLGGLMLVPLAAWLEPPIVHVDLQALFGFSYLCIAGALIAYVLWFRGIVTLSPIAVASLGLLSPISAAVLGWIFLDQAIHGYALAGLITVLISVLIVQWSMLRPIQVEP